MYAKTFYTKAFQKKDSLQIAKGYELLGFAHKKDYLKSFTYYDKGIEFSKNLGDNYYPAIFYTYKGVVYSGDGKYEKGLENHLKAIEYAEKNYNEVLIYANKHNIGILKMHLELYDEALQIFKECYLHELNDPNRDQYDFSFSHYSLADIYVKKNQLDSAKKFNKKGYELALKNPLREYFKYYFIANDGIIDFYDKNYEKSIQKIQISINSLDGERDKLLISNGLFHAAKAYDSLDQEKNAIHYYKKVDSVFTKNPHIVSSIIIDTYKRLYTYYRSQNDPKNEALYIEKALDIFDVSKKNFRNLSSKITKTFDRRSLLQKQQELNKALNQKDKSYSLLMRISFIILCIFIIVLISFYIKQKQIKKRFQEFVQQHEQAIKLPKETISIAKEDVTKIGIAEDIIDQILATLEDFEVKKRFIRPDITLPSLSKGFKTNSAYLSKVVNTYKGKKFAEYLNDLRVEYAIEQIRTDKNYRLYTIKAIALEVGFNNSQSFARAFKRKTGIKPSDFIKQSESTAM
ncbi:MAG: helix-turn-helix domain-containing protein [Kordia sp.]|uniref:helix-turn-helix domain-containing protein n=1 Tax=Kordia sp. TaxID=1965332 RepID=UPI003859199F